MMATMLPTIHQMRVSIGFLVGLGDNVGLASGITGVGVVKTIATCTGVVQPDEY